MVKRLPIDIIISIIEYLSYIDTINFINVLNIYEKLYNNKRFINHMDIDKKIFDKIKFYFNNLNDNISILYKYSYKDELEISYKPSNKQLIYNKILNINQSFKDYIKNILSLDLCPNCNIYLYGYFLISILYNRELLFPINISINCLHLPNDISQSYFIKNKIFFNIIFNYYSDDIKYDINNNLIYF